MKDKRTLKYWTEDEIEFLEDNCLDMSAKEMSEKLNRPESSVYTKLRRLGLRSKKHHKSVQLYLDKQVKIKCFCNFLQEKHGWK